MRTSKSPAKQAIYWELDAAKTELLQWRVIRAERQRQAQEALLLVMEAQDEIRCLEAKIEDDHDALRDIDRFERRKTA
jgi:hypothetical protein